MAVQTMNANEDSFHNGLPTFVWRLLIALTILAVLSVAIYVFGAVYGDRMAKVGQTTDPNPIEIIISNDVYSIPANMIRHADQRIGGVTNRVETYVHWPTRSGYSNELASDFASSNPDTINLVFLTFAKRNSLLDMAERFEPVYKNAIDISKIKVLSRDLYVAPLRDEFGYVKERLIYSRKSETGRPSFVARCQATSEKTTRLLLPCETDIFIGESTEMKVRFPLAQLERWQAFSKELAEFSTKLLITQR